MFMDSIILVFLGFAFSVFELIRYFPINKLFIPKVFQLISLILINLSIIIFYPQIVLSISIIITIITLSFTLIPLLLEIRLNKIQFKHDYYAKTRIPEILFYLNWDKYSKAKLNLKYVFIELTKGHLQGALNLLEKTNQDPDLYNYNIWHQEVLKVLLSTRNINLANTYLNTLNINLDMSPNLPAGLVYAMCRIYSEYGDYRNASRCLNYLDKNFHDVQHRTANLTMYLLFYALAGCEENFNYILEEYPRMKNIKTLTYWRAVLLLRTNRRELAIIMLKNYLSKLPPEHKGIAPFIQSLISNPNIYAPLDYEEKPEYEEIVKNTIPRPDDFKHTELFMHKNKAYISTYIISGIVILLTIIQFILSSDSFSDFFTYNPMGSFEFIRLGGFNISLIEEGQWIRYITSIFMHGNWIHLISNIFGLILIGRLVEKSFGGYQLFFIFIISGIAGNFLTHLFHEGVVGVGSSGGVFGIMGAFFLYIIWRRRDLNPRVYKRLIINFIIYIGIQIFFGLSNPQVNNTAHIGGLLGGAGIGALYAFIHDKTPNFKIFYTRICGIISLGLFLLTLFLWYPLINYDYFGNLELVEQYEQKGYQITVPDTWIRTEEEIEGLDKEVEVFIDIYTNSKIYIERLTGSGYTLEEFVKDLKMKINLSTNIYENLTQLENGWFYYAEDVGSKDPNRYDFAYFYYKKYPNSMIRLTSIELMEYTENFKKILHKVLYNIKETN